MAASRHGARSECCIAAHAPHKPAGALRGTQLHRTPPPRPTLHPTLDRRFDDPAHVEIVKRATVAKAPKQAAAKTPVVKKATKKVSRPPPWLPPCQRHPHPVPRGGAGCKTLSHRVGGARSARLVCTLHGAGSAAATACAGAATSAAHALPCPALLDADCTQEGDCKQGRQEGPSQGQGDVRTAAHPT